jgi:hypothetical protein
MLIKDVCNHNTKFNTAPNPRVMPQKNLTSPSCDTVSFSGHAQYERYADKILRHETAMFRERQTDEYIVKYILNKFKNKPDINIIVGGCSTGEEAVTLSMMTRNIKGVNILGFDISEDSIQKAKSRKFMFERPKKQSTRDYCNEVGFSFLKDEYLVFDTPENITNTERENKQLFDEYFVQSDKGTNGKSKGFLKKCSDWLFSQIFTDLSYHMSEESKCFALKEGKATNCDFIQGDIMHIDRIAKDKKADIITFRNALYHLTTDDVYDATYRVQRRDAEETVIDLAQKFKKSLNNDGIVVFGEDEARQLIDPTIVPKAMLKNGFIPLNKTDKHEANVWKMI